MQKTITINVDDSNQYFKLLDLPDGMRLLTKPPMIRKGFGVIDQLSINITIDLTAISETAAAAWLLNKLGSHLTSIGRNRDLHIDHSSENHAIAISAISNKIESEKNDEQHE